MAIEFGCVNDTDEGTDTMENRLESLPKFEFKDIENTTKYCYEACYEVRRAWAVPHMSSDEMYALYEIARRICMMMWMVMWLR